MVRDIGGAVVGYFVTALAVMIGFAVAWELFGADFAFRRGTLRVSGSWVLLQLAAGFVAAYLGGWVAARIAGRGLAARLLALVILALGAAQAAWVLSGRWPAVTPPDPSALTAFEAAAVAIQPTWYLVLGPLVGAAGAVIGGTGRG